MSQSDRAFGRLLASAAAVGAVLALPLALTVFPGAIQQALHASDSVLRTCAAVVYALGRDLPPLGFLVLALAVGPVVATIVRVTRLLRRTTRVTRRAAIATPADLLAAARRVGIAPQLRVFSDEAPLAYTAGLVHPRIWVSTALSRGLSAAELDAVLWHEREHLLRRDPLRMVTARTVSSLFIIVPAIRLAAARFEVAKELDADRAAIRAPGGASALAGALMTLGERSASAELAIGAWSMTTVRVDQLCGEDPWSLLPRASRRVRALSVAALGLALLLTFGQAARANVLPGSFMELGGDPMGETLIHTCPLPVAGMLL